MDILCHGQRIRIVFISGNGLTVVDFRIGAPGARSPRVLDLIARCLPNVIEHSVGIAANEHFEDPVERRFAATTSDNRNRSERRLNEPQLVPIVPRSIT